MSWFRIDDAFLDHPKVQQLERAGARMWADGIAVWLAIGVQCNRNLTDGTLPLERVYRATPLAKRRVKQVLPVLVEAGLLTLEGDVVQVVNYLKWQDSKSAVKARRAGSAKRTAKSRAASSLDHSLDYSLDHKLDHELQTDIEQKQPLSSDVTVLPTPLPYPYQDKSVPPDPQLQKVSEEEKEENRAPLSVDLRSREGMTRQQVLALAGQHGVTPNMSSKQHRVLSKLCTEVVTRAQMSKALQAACAWTHPRPPSMGQVVSKLDLQRRDEAQAKKGGGSLASQDVRPSARDRAMIADDDVTEMLMLAAKVGRP